MKVLIIGGVAGGASTAARLRRLDENAEIIIFERGKNISFASCGIPYYTGNVIKEREKLEVLTPQSLNGLLNIDVRTESEVIRIDRDRKTILVKDIKLGKEYEENYDKLVLSPGASPARPSIPGLEDPRIFTVRTLQDAEKIKLAVESSKKAAVIGAGYVGLEMAENLRHMGLDVSVIEMSPQILNNVDSEVACQLGMHMREKGVNLLLEEAVDAFEEGKNLVINLRSGKKIEVDMAIFAIGVRPENQLAQNAGLKIGVTGGISVNNNLQTSDEDIYALGDAIEVIDFISGNESLIPLAGPANRQGRIVAENISGLNSEYKATQGTAFLKLFDLTVGLSGNNEKQLKKNNIPYLKAYAQGFSHADYYPGAFPIGIKLLFSPKDGKVLGVQVIGKEGVDKRTDVLATVIKFGGTIKDVIDLELSYAPPVGSAKDVVNIAGMIAENILKGFVSPVYWDELEHLSSDTFILDVRADADMQKVSGSLDGTVRIPLEQLRGRLNELPKDKPILVYCAKGLKSYFASRILSQSGFKNVKSLNGGFMVPKLVQKCQEMKA